VTLPAVSAAYLEALRASGLIRDKVPCVHCGPMRKRPWEPIVRIWRDGLDYGSRCFRCEREERSSFAVPDPPAARSLWLWRTDDRRRPAVPTGSGPNPLFEPTIPPFAARAAGASGDREWQR